MVHGSQLGLLYRVLNGQQLPGLLPRLVIVSSSGSNVGNVSGIAGGDVDRDRHFHLSWFINGDWGQVVLKKGDKTGWKLHGINRIRPLYHS